MREYPIFQNASDLQALKAQLGLVGTYRDEDIAEFNNIAGRVATIRKGTRIPTSSADVLATDRPGDFNWDATGFFYLESKATGWRFIASSTF